AEDHAAAHVGRARGVAHRDARDGVHEAEDLDVVGREEVDRRGEARGVRGPPARRVHREVAHLVVVAGLVGDEERDDLRAGAEATQERPGAMKSKGRDWAARTATRKSTPAVLRSRKKRSPVSPTRTW